jgi:hypothetical protein
MSVVASSNRDFIHGLLRNDVRFARLPEALGIEADLVFRDRPWKRCVFSIA